METNQRVENHIVPSIRSELLAKSRFGKVTPWNKCQEWKKQ